VNDPENGLARGHPSLEFDEAEEAEPAESEFA
jgi:hypothetical protein